MTHVVVIGAGAIGIAVAHRMIAEGFSVALLDAASEPASQASFANGGQISACDAAPWAGPGTPFQLLAWMLKSNPVFRWSAGFPDRDQIAWLLAFLRRCRRGRQRQGFFDNLALGLYSRECLRRRLEEIGDPDGRSCCLRRGGILHLLWSRRDLRRAEAKRAMLDAAGEPSHLLDPEACRRREPALDRPAFAALKGGFLAPGDGSGDAHGFARRLLEDAQRRGLVFIAEARAQDLEWRQTANGALRVDAVIVGERRIAADIVILAAGCGGAALMRRLGVAMPICPIKGYSLTAHGDAADMPGLSLTDLRRRMVISRLGDRLRIAGLADFAGDDATVDPDRLDALRRNAAELFPGIVNARARLDAHSCLRPMTPDGSPLIGFACRGDGRFDNLLIDGGHGSLGWTLACGSADLIADLIGGRRPAVDLRPFSPSRFAA